MRWESIARERRDPNCERKPMACGCSQRRQIRILREVDGGRSVRELRQEKNISEATHHRWRAQFGLMELNEARRLKERERENSELKKMLAESLLKNRILEAVCEKGSGRGGNWRNG